MTTAFNAADREEGTSANERQIGGSHYASSLQHWDLIELYGIGYLEGCATKYVTRARKKNGLQDLHKADHYVQKLLELYEAGRRVPRGVVPMRVLIQFSDENKLEVLESAVIMALCTWNTRAHLLGARKDLRDLITQHTPKNEG